jgi:hypothetical protein
MDDIAHNAIDGELDVDLAELSLGQRLTALSGDARPVTSSDSDDEATTQKSKVPRKGQGAQDVSVVPANSLTRTLIQALHSSDTRLLETCLAHSDQALIRNTVRRLPPQLAVPLITACVERLGRGARAGNMKGGGGGASSQRATTLILWVKTVLAVHSGHLMTVGLNKRFFPSYLCLIRCLISSRDFRDCTRPCHHALPCKRPCSRSVGDWTWSFRKSRCDHPPLPLPWHPEKGLRRLRNKANA